MTIEDPFISQTVLTIIPQIYADGIDNSVESEGMDRVNIDWTGVQLDMIGQLAAYGKPMIVLQMGGGQLDDTPLLQNPNVSAIIWGGYPGKLKALPL